MQAHTPRLRSLHSCTAWQCRAGLLRNHINPTLGVGRRDGNGAPDAADMVWFNCDDCGESLKKPKVIQHFGSCSASSFTCIDCSRSFTRQTVKTHTQCVTEHDKYAKGVTKPGGHAVQGYFGEGGGAADTPAQQTVTGTEFLSTRPPWKCSVCNVSCTSQETLVGHASGAKHRRRAKAALAAAQTPAAEGGQVAGIVTAPAASVLVPNGPVNGAASKQPADANGSAAQNGAAVSLEAGDKELRKKRKGEQMAGTAVAKPGKKVKAAGAPELSDDAAVEETGQSASKKPAKQKAGKKDKSSSAGAVGAAEPKAQTENTTVEDTKSAGTDAAAHAANGSAHVQTKQQRKQKRAKGTAADESNGSAGPPLPPNSAAVPAPGGKADPYRLHDGEGAAGWAGKGRGRADWKRLAIEQLRKRGGEMELKKLQSKVLKAGSVPEMDAFAKQQLMKNMLAKWEKSVKFEIADNVVRLKR